MGRRPSLQTTFRRDSCLGQVEGEMSKDQRREMLMDPMLHIESTFVAVATVDSLLFHLGYRVCVSDVLCYPNRFRLHDTSAKRIAIHVLTAPFHHCSCSFSIAQTFRCDPAGHSKIPAQ